MADSKIFLALALACLPAFVCLSPLAEVVAHDDLGFGNTTTTTTTTAAIDTSSALPLRCTDADGGHRHLLRASSTRHDLDADGGSTLCLRKVSTHPYDGVLPLKDGSGRLLCWNRNGLIWLAAPPVDVDPATGSVLSVTGKPLIDLGSRISQDAAARGRGLAGVAVHSSGRLLMSYYTTDDDVGPAPDGVGAFLVVDQLSASSWSEHEANRADPAQSASRVFSMALPQAKPLPSSGVLDYYGGQILFRPNNADPFLYLVTGPAQSDGQLQAKILRFHVGQDSPSGNGTVTPVDAQSYAAWLGIPRRCAFDAERPQDLYCAIAKDEQEQVYLISDPDAPSSSSTPPSPSLLVAHQRPTPGTPPSLVGGLLYRGYADNTLTGSYIYMDRSEFWGTVASPARNYTTTRNLRVTCFASTTSPCRSGDFAAAGGGGVTSFGEDEGNNALLLATDGVYQVVGPSLCRHAATHTKAPMSTKKLLEWVLGALLATTTLGGGYIVYKKCSCFNSMNDINVNAPNGNVNVFNGNNGIQLAVNN